jgi:hypothetical protein
VIFLITLIALSFKAILSYITCFTTFYIIATKLKSIDFSVLAFSITFNKVICIDWLIIIISLIIADLLTLLTGSSL